MSNEDIYKEFSDFSSKMVAIAILTLINFIWTLFSWIFGIIGFIIGIIINIIIIIFFLLIIGDIKKAGKILNNKDLLGFPLKFILGTILRFIGQRLLLLGISLVILILIEGGGRAILLISIILILIGFILMEIGSVLRLLAWSGLHSFFTSNLSLFPADVGNDGIEGAKLCKIATIFDMTIILWLVAEILRIIGYFKMSSWNFKEAPIEPTPQQVTPLPPASQAPSANYCPDCGNEIGSESNFCPNCGAEID